MRSCLIKIAAIILLAFITESNFVILSARNYTYHHPLIIEGEIERPPYEFRDKDGSPNGFNVDLLSMIATRLNIPYKIILKNWPDVVKDIHEGKADLACSLYSSERQGMFLFSNSVFDIYHHNVVYRKDGPPVNTFIDLNGKSVCVLKNGSVLNYLKQKKFRGKIITANNMIGVIDSVAQGKAFAAITGQQSARYHIFKGDYSNLITADIGLLTAEYHFVSQDARLLRQVDSVYTIISNSGEVDTLYNSWFHSKIKKNVIPPFFKEALVMLLIAVALLVIFSFVYKKRFRRAQLIINEKNDDLQALFGVTAISVLKYIVNDRRIYNMMGKYIPDNGLTLEEITSMIYKDDQTLFTEVIKSLSNGDISDSSNVFRCDFTSSGKWPYIETVMKRVESNIDHHVDIIISVKDITDSFINNITRDSLFRRYKAVFNSTNVGLIYFDNNNLLTDVNDMVKSILIIENKSAVIKRRISLDTILCKYISSYDYNKPYYGIVRYNFDDIHAQIPEFRRRGIAYLEHQITPLFNEKGEKTGTIVTLIDKTDDRNRYMQERQLRKELKEETVKAQESDMLKSVFLANMSHEIRTPLNSIVGFSDLICQTNNPEEKAQFIKMISTSTDQLLRLINDILDISKMDANIIKLEPKETDFALDFEDICNILKRQIKNPDVKFIHDAPYTSCIVTIDKERISQLITNLVINANKFTEKGHIRVGYSYADKGLNIFCEDTGKGISKENKEKIFDRFFKGDEFAPGTGLGLSICQKIVNQNNGRITVESELGKGSTFRIWIPLEAKIIE